MNKDYLKDIVLLDGTRHDGISAAVKHLVATEIKEVTKRLCLLEVLVDELECTVKGANNGWNV